MKSFKEFEDIDEKCEECIFEHELEGIQEQSIRERKLNLMTLSEVVVRSFMYMLRMRRVM